MEVPMTDLTILDALRSAVPDGLITAANQLQTYECDGLTNFRTMPGAVVLPRSAEQVQAVVRACAKYGVPFVARGAGTGLSGGALPAEKSVVISFARMNRILNIDIPNQRVEVEPGVINQHVTDAVAPYGYFYAPDPSSQSVCTIGGNVAENSGGAHCLKYGFTTTHVLGMDVVLPTGEMVQLGSAAPDAPGYDLPGLFVGSEGTLGVATRLTLRIVKRPETVQVLLAAFDSIRAAGQTVSVPAVREGDGPRVLNEEGRPVGGATETRRAQRRPRHLAPGRERNEIKTRFFSFPDPRTFCIAERRGTSARLCALRVSTSSPTSAALAKPRSDSPAAPAE